MLNFHTDMCIKHVQAMMSRTGGRWNGSKDDAVNHLVRPPRVSQRRRPHTPTRFSRGSIDHPPHPRRTTHKDLRHRRARLDPPPRSCQVVCPDPPRRCWPSCLAGTRKVRRAPTRTSPIDRRLRPWIRSMRAPDVPRDRLQARRIDCDH